MTNETTKNDAFIEGAEVIHIDSGWNGRRHGSRYKIGKVYKNGNFILEGDADRQQWRPSNFGCAYKTGDSYLRGGHLELYQGKHAAEAAEQKAKHDRIVRLRKAQGWLNDKRDLTTEALDLIEAAIAKENELRNN